MVTTGTVEVCARLLEARLRTSPAAKQDPLVGNENDLFFMRSSLSISRVRLAAEYANQVKYCKDAPLVNSFLRFFGIGSGAKYAAPSRASRLWKSVDGSVSKGQAENSPTDKS